MKHPHNSERLEEYINGLIEGKYTLRQVSDWTGYTCEHLCRKKKLYMQKGAACLVDGRVGKKGHRPASQARWDKIASIYKEDFCAKGACINFAAFRECLARSYGISLSETSVHRILKQSGIKSPLSRSRYSSPSPPPPPLPRQPQSG